MLKRFLYKVVNRMLYSGKFGDVPLRKALFIHLPDDRPLRYIDIGAFDGHFYDIVRREKTISAAVLIEPQANQMQLLRQRFGNDSAVSLHEVVLSDAPGRVSFYTQALSATSSMLPMDKELLGGHLDTATTSVTEHEATTLDLLLAADSLPIDLLKIDVQGAELTVLKGATATLQRTTFIWIEVSFKPLYTGSTTFPEIRAALEAQGFILIGMLDGYKNKNGELLQADCLFKRAER